MPKAAKIIAGAFAPARRYKFKSRGLGLRLFCSIITVQLRVVGIYGGECRGYGLALGGGYLADALIDVHGHAALELKGGVEGLIGPADACAGEQRLRQDGDEVLGVLAEVGLHRGGGYEVIGLERVPRKGVPLVDGGEIYYLRARLRLRYAEGAVDVLIYVGVDGEGGGDDRRGLLPAGGQAVDIRAEGHELRAAPARS